MGFRTVFQVLIIAGLLTATLLAPTLHAQTTGGIVGRVTDELQTGLPGVTVEAQSPALQGVRIAVTDNLGAYRLTLLPPGTYSVRFTLAGFAGERREGVEVGLDRDTTVNALLRPETGEEITVIGETPVIDATSARPPPPRATATWPPAS